MKPAPQPCKPLASEPTADAHSISYVLVIVAAVALGLAVRDSDGNISPEALRWLTLSLVAAFSSLLTLGSSPLGRVAHVSRWLLLAAVCIQLAALQWLPFLLRMLAADFSASRSCAMLMGIGAVLAGVVVVDDYRRSRWVLPVLVVVYLAIGWLAVAQPVGIDVHMFQMEGSRALLAGQNPYTLRFPDPYPPESSARFYGPGVSVNGVLQFGYPYLPTTLLLAIPGYLAGDTRYASLFAIALSAVLIAYARPSRASAIAATVLLSTPAFPLMAFAAWTDAYVLLLLSAVWFCQCRAKWLLPYAVGLLLSSKQYMIVAAPLALLLVERPWTLRRLLDFGARAFITGCAVVVPFALWDLQAFWQSVVALQFHQPFREDALSYLVWLHPADPSKWLLLPFAVVAAVWLVLWPLRYRLNFALATALVLVAFFAVNKQAFANYYYLVIGALCVAAAGLGSSDCSVSSDGASATIKPSSGRSDA